MSENLPDNKLKREELEEALRPGEAFDQFLLQISDKIETKLRKAMTQMIYDECINPPEVDNGLPSGEIYDECINPPEVDNGLPSGDTFDDEMLQFFTEISQEELETNLFIAQIIRQMSHTDFVDRFNRMQSETISKVVSEMRQLENELN